MMPEPFSSIDWTPICALEDALAKVKSGEIKHRKFYGIFLDDEGGRYHTRCVCAGMNNAEVIALLQFTGIDLVHEMLEVD